MRRFIASLGISLFFAAKAASASLGTTPVDAEQSSSRPMDSEGMAASRGYAQGVGREVLKKKLGVDLNALRFQFNPHTLRLEKIDRGGSARSTGVPANGFLPAFSPTGLPADQHYSSKLSLKVDQSGDLLRMGSDRRDIPFGMEVESEVPLMQRLTALQTKVWVPFSWRDEIKASAVVPLNKLRLGNTDGLFNKLNLNDRLDLRSDYSNHLGVNQLEAGLGTQWQSQFLGLMDLDYGYSQRFGQRSEETTHWLKLKRDF